MTDENMEDSEILQNISKREFTFGEHEMTDQEKQEEKNRRRERGLYGHEDAGAVALELLDELAEKGGDWVGAGRVELRRSSKMVLRGGYVDGVSYYPPNYEVAYRPHNWKEVDAETVRFFVDIADRYSCHVVFKSQQDKNIETVFRGRQYNG